MKIDKTVALSLLLALPTAVDAQTKAASEDAPTRTVATAPAGQPRYLEAIRTELQALGIEASCEATDPQRGGCAFTQHGGTSEHDFRVRLNYSDRTDTIYIYIESFVTLLPDASGTDTTVRRMMELNWQMLLGKFEWDPMRGEVRLSMTLNTDSNFDRRAFRGAIRGLVALADRHHGELTRLAAGSE